MCTNPYQVCCSSGLTRVNAPNTGPYTLLENIPGSSNTIGNFRTYLEDIYRFAFWVIGIAVVLMLTIGGFMYLTSAGNTSRMESAKTVIFDAILGLCLALVAWLFLYVINPDLVNVTLPSSTPSAPATTTPPTPGTGGTPTPTGPAPGTAASYAQQILAGGTGVTAVSTGSCNQQGGQVVSPQLTLQQVQSSGTATSCHSTCSTTNLCSGSTALNTTMLRKLISVGSVYPFNISSLTGGRHSANSRHYQGRAVDIVPTVPKAQWPAVAAAFRSGTDAAPMVICDIPNPNGGNGSISIPCDSPQANHIHAEW